MNKSIAISAAVILALCTVGKCYGRGRLGHRTIAEIAERQMRKAAYRLTKALNTIFGE